MTEAINELGDELQAYQRKCELQAQELTAAMLEIASLKQRMQIDRDNYRLALRFMLDDEYERGLREARNYMRQFRENRFDVGDREG